MAEAYGDYECVNLEGGITELKSRLLEKEDERILCFFYKEGYEHLSGVLKETGMETELLEESQHYKAVMIK